MCHERRPPWANEEVRYIVILVIERMKRTAVMDGRDNTTLGPLSRRCGGLGRDVYVVGVIRLWLEAFYPFGLSVT